LATRSKFLCYILYTPFHILWFLRRIHGDAMKLSKEDNYQIGMFMVMLAIMFYSYEYFLRVVPSVMINFYKHDYGISDKGISFIATAYFLSYTPLQLFVGSIADTFGVRVLLLFSVMICVVGVLVSATCLAMPAITPYVFELTVLGRFFIGFGSAFAFVAVMKTAREWLPNKYFPTISGMTTSLGMLGAISAQTLFPVLFLLIGEANSLWVMTIIGIILYLATHYYMFDHPSHFKIQRTNQISSLFKALYHVISIPQIWVNGLIGAAMFMPTVIFSDLWAPKFFEDVDHIAHPVSGVVSSMLYWGWIAGSPLVGLLSSFIGKRRIIIQVSSLLAAITITFIIYYPISNPWIVGSVMFLMGLFCSAQILTFAVANDIVEEKYVASGIAVTNMLIMCSGFLQPYIGQLLQDSAYNEQMFNADGFRQALMVMPSAMMLAFLLSFMLKESASNNKHH